MSAKKRVRRTLTFEKTDRVPIDYAANPVINKRLMDALGLRSQEALLTALGVDFRVIEVSYTGPQLFPAVAGHAVDPEYGFVSRWVPNQYGGYQDFCRFPLQDAEEALIDAWPFPDPDAYDYENLSRQVKRYEGKALYIGSPGYPDIINSLGRVMGMEDCLVNLQLRDAATLRFIRRKANFELAKLERMLHAIRKAGSEADFLMLGEDLGTQLGPMIHQELFDDIFRPVFARYISLAEAHQLPVMVHSCGSSSWVFERFIKMGIRAVDALQPEAANMSPAYLAAHFGGRLGFHGCISTAALASSSAEKVKDFCGQTLDIMMPSGGYHFSPTHMIQDNTPVENILAMYQTAHQRGIYA